MTAFLTYLLQNSISTGITLLIVILICRVLVRLPASFRCWLLRLAFLKCLLSLFIPLAITVPILPPPIAVPPSLSRSDVVPSQVPLAPPATVLPGDGISKGRISAQADEVPFPPSLPPEFWLVALYGIGLMFSIVRLIVAGSHTWRLVREAKQVSHPVLVELVLRFGRKSSPPLARTPDIVSPLLAFGTILLPEETDMDEQLLLAHELAHLQRRDLVWEWFGVLTQTILWFHPLVWLARREERLTCEQAADALVLSVCGASPAEYARILLITSLRRSGRPPLLSVGAVERGSRLRLRLIALTQPGLPRRRALAFGAFALLVTVLSSLPWRAVARQNVIQIQPASTKELQKDSILSGTVINNQGKPVANAHVSWVVPYEPKPAVIAETQTNAKGEFVFENAPTTAQPGETLKDHWRRNLDGWVMVKAEGFGLGVKRVRFDKRTVTLSLTPPHTYTVAVRDGMGKPVVGLPVWSETLNNEHNFFGVKWLGYSGKTNTRGEYQAKGLPENDTVWFRIDLSRLSIQDQKTTGDQTIITVGAGHVLEGIVHYPNGRPVRNANIQLNAQSGTPVFTGASASSDSQGHYRIQGLATGEYTLRVYPGSNPGMTGPNPTVLRIPEGMTTVRKDIEFVRAVTVTGRITDETGKPFVGIGVGGGSNYTGTDQQGKYSLDVPPGNTTITIQGREMKKIQVRRDTANTLDLTIPRGNLMQLRGTVKNSKGEPVPGINVSVFGQQMASSTTADSLGNFTWSLAREKAGPLTVYTHKGDEGATVVVEPGKTDPIELRLSESNVGHIKGQVIDPAGKPIQSVRIRVSEGLLTNMDNKPPIDPQGRFSIPILQGLPYRLNFEADGYGVQSVPSLYHDLLTATFTKGMTVPTGETKDLGQVVLRRGTGTATGHILNNGKSLANVNIFLVTASGMWPSKTDSQGVFTIPHVVKGEPGMLFVASRLPLRRKVIVGDFGTVNLTAKDLVPHR